MVPLRTFPLLTLMLIVVGMTACGGDNPPESSQTTTTSLPAQQEYPTSQPECALVLPDTVNAALGTQVVSVTRETDDPLTCIYTNTNGTQNVTLVYWTGVESGEFEGLREAYTINVNETQDVDTLGVQAWSSVSSSGGSTVTALKGNIQVQLNAPVPLDTATVLVATVLSRIT